MATTSFDDLPQQASANIFSRLPVKDLIRSTSVNKKWYSLITSPTFISAQIKHAISHCPDNAVFIIPPCPSQQKHCPLICVETSKVLEKYEVPFTTRSDTLKLVSSVDGLMLLTDSDMFYYSRDLYLWNPCVKSHRTLVSSCFKKLIDNSYMSSCIVGLGFNRREDDYRVVRIVYVRDKMLNFWGDVAPKAEVYSLKKNTWKKIKEPAVPRLGAQTGVYVNGSYYWLEMKRPSTQVMGRPYNSNDLWMVSFDFDSEVFGEVKIPKKVSNCLGVGASCLGVGASSLGLGARFKLMRFEGLLALCVFDVQDNNGVTTHPHRVWLMKQENGVRTWNLRFRAELKDNGYPLNITKAGTILIETYPVRGRMDITGIYSCNLKTMRYKDLGFGRHEGGAEGSLLMPEACTANASFMESLVMYEGGKALSNFAK